MSAPFFWIILPILIGLFTLLLVSEHATTIAGGTAAAALAVLALVLPIDEALKLGPLSLKVASSASFLGRSLVLPATTAPLLAVIFGMCALWFFGAEAAGTARRLIPLGLIITGLLVASIAVQPFLFASLLIETAVLVAVPLLAEPGQKPGRGVVRFLIYQTLGMPFILLAGWLLAGVEASPGDLSFTLQSTVMLGLGFAFLLAIFPLYNWIPQLLEETSPYVAGFLIWLLPTVVIVFAMSFLDRYAWLRTSPQIVGGLRLAGVIMLVTGAWWATFERHLGRLMAYAAIAETGFLLLALGLASANSASIVFLFLIPRGLGLAIWSLGLSVLRKNRLPFELSSAHGLARSYPFAAGGIILAALSSAGYPLLAGFPARLALWQGLSAESSATAAWYLIGLLGLLVGAVRQLATVVSQREEGPWKPCEDLIERGMLGVGVLGLTLLGVFPRITVLIAEKLPLMFQHLNR
ncbi:MAG TPA: proton-conducting transporter membrane subunit [Anaerolineales bacterium]|nr:proton-conducting transporter membrane subunit [Anaerolineales bacterium]